MIQIGSKYSKMSSVSSILTEDPSQSHALGHLKLIVWFEPKWVPILYVTENQLSEAKQVCSLFLHKIILKIEHVQGLKTDDFTWRN